jgi:hypothetical protein
MVSDVLDSKDFLTRLIRRWPWLLLAACTGGVLGLGLSCLLPPVYEAQAVVGVGIDYGRALPLDEEATRLAFDRVREVFLSDVTLQKVMAWAGSAPEGSMGTVNQFRDTLRLSEVGGGWELAVRHASPQTAARQANLWKDASLEALQAAAAHAWRAAGLQAKWYTVGCRLEPVATPSPGAAWSCSAAPDEYDPEQALTEIEHEAILSLGVLPAMSFSALRAAETPLEPLAGARGMLVLAGCLAGSALGLVAALSWPGKKGRGSA